MHRILLGLAAAAALSLGAASDANAQGISIGFSSGYGGWGGPAVSGSYWGHNNYHHRGVSPRYHNSRVYRPPVNYGYGGYPYGVSRSYGYRSSPHVTRRYATPRYRVCPTTGRYFPY